LLGAVREETYPQTATDCAENFAAAYDAGISADDFRGIAKLPGNSKLKISGGKFFGPEPPKNRKIMPKEDAAKRAEESARKAEALRRVQEVARQAALRQKQEKAAASHTQHLPKPKPDKRTNSTGPKMVDDKD
jgi:hypothetical protein